MAGLLDPNDQTTGTMMSGDVMPRGRMGGMRQEMADDTVPDEGEEESNVTPEEQAAYEAFVLAGGELIYEGGEVRPTILEMLDEDPSDLMDVLEDAKDMKEFTPSVALAATTVTLVLELVRNAEEKPDAAIIFHGGKELLEELANAATEAGVHDYTEEEINQAMLMAMDLYREAAGDEGLLDVDALKDEFDEIVTADKEGKLGELIPQLASVEAMSGPEQVEAPDGGVR